MWVLFMEGEKGAPPPTLNSKYPKWVLVPGEYTVGRTKSNIMMFEGDNSVELTCHAVIRVFIRENAQPGDRPGVVLEDKKSKYGTWVNPGTRGKEMSIRECKKIQSGENVARRQLSKPTDLQDDDVVQFGHLNFVTRLRWVELNVISSMLRSKETKQVNDYLAEFAGKKIQPGWTSSTTHLVMSSIRLSPKVLNCLAGGVPIVTPDFFRDFVSAMTTKQAVPDPENYVPSVSPDDSEMMLRQPGVDLRLNPERKTLFAGVEFVLMTDSQRREIEQPIALAGGSTSTWTSKVDLNSDNVILVKPKSITDIQKVWSSVLDSLAKVGRQVVSITSVYMALVHCDVSKCSNARTRSAVLPPSGGGMSQSSYIIRAPDSLAFHQDSGSSHSSSDRTSNPNSSQQNIQGSSNPPSLRTKAVASQPLSSVNVVENTASSMSSIATGPPPSLTTNQTTGLFAAPANQKDAFIGFKEPMISHIRPPAANDSIQISGNLKGSSRVNAAESDMFQSTNSSTRSEASKAALEMSSQLSQEFNPSTAMTSTQQERKRGLSSEDEAEAQVSKRPALVKTSDNQQPEEKQKSNSSQASEKTSQYSYSKVETKTSVANTMDDFSDDDDIFSFDEPKASLTKPSTANTGSQKRKAEDDDIMDDDDDDLFGFDEIKTVSSSTKKVKMSTQIEAGEAAPTFDNQLSAIDARQDTVGRHNLATPPATAGSTQNKAWPRDEKKHQPAATPTSANTTAGFLSKSRVKNELGEDGGLSGLPEKFYSLVVKKLFRPDITNRSRNETTLDSTCDSLTTQRGGKCFVKQKIARPLAKVPLTGKRRDDECIDKWFQQNPEISLNLQQEEQAKEDVNAFWNFHDSQGKNSQVGRRGR